MSSYTKPIIEAAYPHVVIGSKIIIWQLQHQLQDAATLPSYQEYLQNKFQWPENSFTIIH